MRIGIIGPSRVREKEIISQLAKIIAGLGYEIVLTPDRGSSSEFFAQEYLNNNGKKVFEVVPLDDKEFGHDLINLELGEHINCGTWRNQSEKLNEETDVLLCVGYATGVLAEMAYTKWFKPKPVYIIKELVSKELPNEVKLDIRYVSIKELKKILK